VVSYVYCYSFDESIILVVVVQLYTSSKFSVAMTTDPAVMAEAGMLQQNPAVDLLWIVASICFLVVFSLFVVLVVVFARSYRNISSTSSALIFMFTCAPRIGLGIIITRVYVSMCPSVRIFKNVGLQPPKMVVFLYRFVPKGKSWGP